MFSLSLLTFGPVVVGKAVIIKETYFGNDIGNEFIGAEYESGLVKLGICHWWSDTINIPNTNIHMLIGHILKHNPFLINYNNFLSNNY